MNRCHLVTLCCPVVRRPNLEVVTKRLLSAGKNTGVVLLLCCAWKCVPTAGVVLVLCCARKCVPTAISGGVDISEVPGCHLL